MLEMSTPEYNGTALQFSRYFLCTGGAYYVPYSCLLISNKFCNGGSGPSRANKFLYAPAPPPPSVWALKPSSSFLGPKWHSPIDWMPFHRAQQTLEFQGPTPSYLPSLVMDMHSSKTLWTGLINHRCINSYIFLAFLLNLSTTNWQIDKKNYGLLKNLLD